MSGVLSNELRSLKKTGSQGGVAAKKERNRKNRQERKQRKKNRLDSKLKQPKKNLEIFFEIFFFENLCGNSFI